MADAFPVYESLWQRTRDDGIFVHYDYWPDKSLAGYFQPHNDEEPERSPEIAIRRPYFIEPDDEPRRESNAPSHCPQPNIDAELFTLAHEYGHACSSAGRTEATEYKLYEAAARHRDSVTEEKSKRLPSGLSMLEPLQGDRGDGVDLADREPQLVQLARDGRHAFLRRRLSISSVV